tara:strand:- start:3164 stop:3694 length:531 start_codon:yes stop_codon:yes gene_type:complete
MRSILKVFFSLVFGLISLVNLSAQESKVFFWENGNLKQKAFYKYTMLNGYYYEWHENGQLKEQSENCLDLPCGQKFTWDELGNLLTVETLDTLVIFSGEINGFIAETTLPYYDLIKFHKNGKIDYVLDNNYPKYSKSLYSSDGQVYIKMNYLRIVGVKPDSLIGKVKFDTTFVGPK